MTCMPSPESFLDGRVAVHHGDSRDVLRAYPDSHFHAVVCDPPYALVSIVKRFGAAGAPTPRGGNVYARTSAGFMGQRWDTGETAFSADFWSEVLRVLKPGGHLIAASGARTYHRLACAVEDAGFEIRDMIEWIYAGGFPKSHDVAAGIDKLDAATARRERQLRFTAWMRSTGINAATIDLVTGSVMGSHYLTAATQPLIATRAHLEAMRPHLGEVPSWVEEMVDDRTVESEAFKAREIAGHHASPAQASRWRADLGFGREAEPKAITVPHTSDARAWAGWGTALKPAHEPWVLARRPFDGTVAETVLQHGTGALNIDGCRVSGADDGLCGRWPANVMHDGSTTVGEALPTRFFFGAKATARDRAGSRHPTVKPVDLMRYLIRLVAPPGGLILDPFAGSGTTGEAAWREGATAVLIEREADYVADIRRRLEHMLAGPEVRRRSLAAAARRAAAELPLFGRAEAEDADDTDSTGEAAE
jgi:site-specific DNA-methyltransferase (adenine-specific)